MKPISILKRLAAFTIDYIIITIILSIFLFLFADAIKETPQTALDSAKIFLNNTIKLIPGHEPSMIYKIIEKFSFYFAHMKSTAIICGILYFAYFVFFEQSKWQGTIGKKFLKLKVLDINNKRLSFIKSSKRFLIFITPSLFIHFLALFIYPQCISSHHRLMRPEIEIPTICITLLVGYGIGYIIWFVPIFFKNSKATTYDILSKTKVKD